MQYAAECYSVLQSDAVWCSVMQCVVVQSMLQSHMISTAIKMFCVAECCSALRFVVVYCSHTWSLLKSGFFVLQCAAVCCSVLQCVAVTRDLYCNQNFLCCSMLQCVAVCCRHTWSLLQSDSIALHCVAVRCSVLQCLAINYLYCNLDFLCCSIVQCVAVCCSVLQSHVPLLPSEFFPFVKLPVAHHFPASTLTHAHTHTYTYTQAQTQAQKQTQTQTQI